MIEFRTADHPSGRPGSWLSSAYPDLPGLIADQTVRYTNADGSWTEYRLRKSPRFRRVQGSKVDYFDKEDISKNIIELFAGGAMIIEFTYNSYVETWTKVD